ncbi:hypothetical protein GCM10009789_34340 [Kribbella sancticallisti]|uniref:Uncharacterized protein n=1 Tax=Kribbella sancticallisti TaxID=460087 RepID=A0ABP4PG73_9ACTN
MKNPPRHLSEGRAIGATGAAGAAGVIGVIGAAGAAGVIGADPALCPWRRTERA